MISHKKKLVFIHIPKTGGKTLSKFLAPYCDEESLRLFSPMIDEGNLHASWGDYIEYYGPKIAEYDVVSIVRNPWEKALSLATHQAELYYKTKNLDLPDDWKLTRNWSEYLTEILVQPYRYGFWPHSHFTFWTNYETYRDNIDNNFVESEWPAQTSVPGWQMIMDRIRYPTHIIRFENYSRDVETLLQHYDIKYDPAEVCRKTNTSKHGHYREYYSSREQVESISTTCGFDIQAFGYTY